jgi:hypothetical protein
MDGVPARFLIPVVSPYTFARYSTAQRDEVGRLARSLEPDLAGIAQQVGLSPPITQPSSRRNMTTRCRLLGTGPFLVERRRRQHRMCEILVALGAARARARARVL